MPRRRKGKYQARPRRYRPDGTEERVSRTFDDPDASLIYSLVVERPAVAQSLLRGLAGRRARHAHEVFWAAFGGSGAALTGPGGPQGDLGSQDCVGTASRAGAPRRGGPAMTWARWVVERKAQHDRSNYAGPTRAAYAYRLQRVASFLGDVPLSSIDDDLLSDLNQDLRSRYSGETPGLTMVAVRMALDDAVERGHLDASPFRQRPLRVRREGWLVADPDNPSRPLTQDELGRFLAAAEAERGGVWRDLFDMARMLCLRPSEAAGLTVESFDGRWLKVWWQLARKVPAAPPGRSGEDHLLLTAPSGRECCLVPPKTWRSVRRRNPWARRRIHLPRCALAVFLRHRRPGGGLLFVQSSGEPCLYGTMRDVGKRVAARAGIPWGRSERVTLHSLRKTGATLLAEAGVRTEVRAYIKGHSPHGLQQTEQYAPPTEEELVAAAAVIDRLVAKRLAKGLGA